MESLPQDFHARVREQFLDLARREPHRYLVLDAVSDVEGLHEQVRERVRAIMPVSPRKLAELRTRLAEEQQARSRRARAEADILRLDAELRARQTPDPGEPEPAGEREQAGERERAGEREPAGEREQAGERQYENVGTDDVHGGNDR
jgi:dTMP kinase